MGSEGGLAVQWTWGHCVIKLAGDERCAVVAGLFAFSREKDPHQILHIAWYIISDTMHLVWDDKSEI